MKLRILTSALLVAAVVPAAAPAATWSTGTYRGTIAGDYGSSHRDGTIGFAIGRTHTTLTAFTVKADCDDDQQRTFTVHGGRGKLNPGPAGAGASLHGKATIEGFEVDWDLVGGVQRSRFRGNFGIGASRRDGGGTVNCTYDGYFSTTSR